MNTLHATQLPRLLTAALSLMLLSACGSLPTAATPHTVFYALEGTAGAAPATVAVGDPAAAPTLLVNPTHAAAGFDSPRIVYVRETHKLEYFAHSEWVDPPERMLAPLLVAALSRSGAFRAVVLAPSAAAGDLRLDTEIVRLQQEFQSGASRVHFTLRAYLVDERARSVLAWREFDAAEAAASEDPYGGVMAANRAVQTVLESLAAFCAEATRSAPTRK